MTRSAQRAGLKLIERPLGVEASLWRRLRYEQEPHCREILFDHYLGLARAIAPNARVLRTFPSLIPVFSLDRVYTRGLRCTSAFVPRGSNWARMSDHLPYVAELELD